MLVLETEAGWQLVEQVDHARLSGALARAWGAGAFAAASEPLRIASDRHDEGWAVWDSHPAIAAERRPMSFLDAPVDALLSSYAACVDALAVEDARAALLVSLHVAGLRRARFGLAPDSASRARAATPREQDERVEAFVAAEEERQRDLRTACSKRTAASSKGTVRERSESAPRELDDELERFEYAQLQLFDVLSLELGLNDLSRAGHERVLDLAPTAAGEPEAPLRVRTLGAARVEVSPWPFAVDSLALWLPRRLLRPGPFGSTAELREAWERVAPEPLAVELVS
ncbi:MAG: DUF3891 family protein [Solirubrobacteraceae bacterium]